MIIGTSSNSVFAVRFAHANAFGTSQTRKTLYEIAADIVLEVRKSQNF
jgi:hypothetical protein